MSSTVDSLTISLLKRRIEALEAEVELKDSIIKRIREERDVAQRRGMVLAKEIDELRREITGGFNGL
jgi:hypothetical protein